MSSTTSTASAAATTTPIFSEQVCYFKNPITKRRVVTNSNTHKKLVLDGVDVPAYSVVKKSRPTSNVKKSVGKKAKISFCMSPENMQNFIMDIRRNIVTNKIFLKAIAKCEENLELKEVSTVEAPVAPVVVTKIKLMTTEKKVEKPSIYSNTEDLSETTSSNGEDSDSGSESE